MSGIRIPIYEQQTSLRGSGQEPRAEGSKFSAGEGEGIGALGKGLADLSAGINAQEVVNARLLHQQQQATDQLTALANVSQSSMDLSVAVEKMKGSAGPGAPDFVPQVSKLIKDHVAQAVEGDGSAYYKDQYARHMAPVSASLIQHALTFQAGASRENRMAQVDQAITNSAKTVALNPGATELELSRLTNMLKTDDDNPFGLLPAQRDKAVEQARKHIVSSALGSWIIRDPVFADSILADASNEALKGRKVQTNNNGVEETLPLHLASVDELNHFRNLARTESERARTNIRQGVDITYGNHLAQLKDGVIPQQPLTEEQVKSAWGNNPAEADQRWQTYTSALQVGQQIGTMKMVPSTDLAKLVGAKPDPTSTNYAKDELLLNVRSQAANDILRQRSDDFIAWGAKNGLQGINPINWADPASIAKEMPLRAAVGNTAVGWGHDYVALSKPEAEQFAGYIGTLQAADQARVLGQVYAAGGATALRSISGQIKDKNDTIAIAGMLYSHGTTAERSVAQMYLEGKEMIKQKRAKMDDKAETGIKADIYKAIDGVYLSPQARDAAADVALGVYAKLKSEGTDSWEKATDIATGGLMDFNGAKIAKPFGWKDSDFRDRITNGIVIPPGDYSIAGVKTSPADLQKSLPGAKLQTYGDGAYLIKAGNDVVRQANGKPFVLKVGP